MPLGGPGPRDWSPSEMSVPLSTESSSRVSAAPPRPCADSWSPRSSTSVGGLATISLLLGVLTAVVATVQPVNDAAGQGFLLCSTGVTAIATGVLALRRGRWGRRAPRVVARAGVTLGVLGTAALAYTLAAFLLVPMGIGMPALPTFTSTVDGATAPLSADQVAAVPLSDALSTSTPVLTAPAPPAEDVPATPDDERRRLAQAVGSMAVLLAPLASAEATSPPHLLVQGVDPLIVATPDGTILGSVPHGTGVRFSADPSTPHVMLELVGGTFGTSARYDTATGIVTTQ